MILLLAVIPVVAVVMLCSFDHFFLDEATSKLLYVDDEYDLNDATEKVSLKKDVSEADDMFEKEIKEEKYSDNSAYDDYNAKEAEDLLNTIYREGRDY